MNKPKGERGHVAPCETKQMVEPKFSIGEVVYVFPVVNRTATVIDRYWEPDLKPYPGFRYRVAGSPAWFPESQVKSHKEIEAFLREDSCVVADDPDHYDGYAHDGDIDCGYCAHT